MSIPRTEDAVVVPTALLEQVPHATRPHVQWGHRPAPRVLVVINPGAGPAARCLGPPDARAVLDSDARPSPRRTSERPARKSGYAETWQRSRWIFPWVCNWASGSQRLFESNETAVARAQVGALS